jgi:hypothetical protein
VHVQDWLARLSGSYGAWLVRNAPEALASALAVFMLGAPLLAPLLLPLAVLAAVLLALRIAQGRCLNWRAYMMRLLRMVAGAAVVAVLSILSGFAAAFLPPGLQGWMALRTG